jgi:acyl-CoA synthetase (AMP-forming)/AMP-acid ligase II
MPAVPNARDNKPNVSQPALMKRRQDMVKIGGMKTSPRLIENKNQSYHIEKYFSRQ